MGRVVMYHDDERLSRVIVRDLEAHGIPVSALTSIPRDKCVREIAELLLAGDDPDLVFIEGIAALQLGIRGALEKEASLQPRRGSESGYALPTLVEYPIMPGFQEPNFATSGCDFGIETLEGSPQPHKIVRHLLAEQIEVAPWLEYNHELYQKQNGILVRK